MNFSGNQAMKSGSCSSSRGGDVDVEDKFPEGLRVLVVDDDPTCLRILEKMLQNCLYKVTTCNRAEVALEFLRENKNGYDIVMSDVHMPDMDGFKLLEHIGLEMDLPVIMMSADDGKKVVMKGITHGACDYLIKPVRMEALKNIWQHVVRKKKHEKKDKNVERSESLEDGEPQQNQSEDFDNSSSANEGNLTGCKKKRDEDEETDDKGDSSTMKKPRVVWSVELHQQFVAAVNTLGIDKAVPKKILEMMNVPGLSRENVASHLQKYRLYLRRLSDMSQHPSGLNTSFLSSPEAAFGSVPLALELQALASSGQLSSEKLASLHAAAFNRQGTSALSMPLTDERSLFSFESQRLGNVQQEANNNSKQLSLLQGIPTNMEPRKLANLHSAQPFLRMNGSSQVNQNYSGFMQMTQLQSRGQVLNQTNGSQVPIIHSSNGQTLLSSAIPRVWTPNGVGGTSYTHVSQGSSVGAFSMKQRSELPGTTFPLMSNPGMASLSSKPVYHREVNTETKDPQNFRPGYDLISGHHIQQIPDWRQQNVRSNFHASQRLASQGACGQQDFRGENINLPVNQGLFSVGGGQNNISSMNPLNPVLADTSMVNSETLTNPDSQSNLFSESYGHDDLMSFLLKQPQDDIIPVDHDFGFNGYSLDNLSS